MDRTFANFYDVAYQKFYGQMAVIMLKMATCGWRTKNDINYVMRGEASVARDEEIKAKGFEAILGVDHTQRAIL